MSMTQRYAGMLRRQAYEWDKQDMPVQAECCRQAARHMQQRENELEHALIVARETLEKECDDGDALLRMIGLDPEQYRTEGGRLNLLRVRAAMAVCNDAERYRYLRNRQPRDVLQTTGDAAGCWIDCEIGETLTLLTGDDADAAIDAAMVVAPAVGAA